MITAKYLFSTILPIITLPLKLDKLDMAILQALMQNGRKSFRQIANQVNTTTPTVESHVRKMFEAGIIRKIAPILNIDRVQQGVSVLLFLKVELGQMNEVIAHLSSLEEVRSIFVTSGESNLVVRVVAVNNDALEEFMNDNIASLQGVNMLSSQVITKTAKDEQGVALTGEISVSLICDKCGGEILGKPIVLNVPHGKRFFCCKSCLTMYKEKYGRVSERESV